MKKIMFMVVAFVALCVASCGNKVNGESVEVAVDSVSVDSVNADTLVVDTVLVDSVAVDTVIAE